MLTERQLEILAYLRGDSEISSVILSKLLNVSTKTIQAEIKDINNYLDNVAKIEFVHGAGYRLIEYTDDFSEFVMFQLEEANTNEESLRSGFILTILAFEKDYISMEKIAEKLFLSKSSISKELEDNWRMRRQLEVSKTRGLKIAIPESKIRLLLSRIIDLNYKVISLLGFEEYYHRMYETILSCVKQVFEAYHVVVSGRSMDEFVSYIFYSAIRSEKNFMMESPLSVQEKPELSSVIQYLTRELTKLIGWEMTDLDTNGIQTKFEQLNFISIRTEDIQVTLSKEDVLEKLQEFSNILHKKLRISLTLDESFVERFYWYINGLYKRYLTGDFYSNFHKRELNKQYPLTAQILRDFFVPIFDFPIVDAELAFIIPFFADKVERKHEFSVLLISDQYTSLVDHLMYNIKSLHLPYDIKLLTHVPSYIYDGNAEYYQEHYQIILTTEKAVSFQYQSIMKISEVANETDFEWLSYQMNQRMSRYIENKIGEMNQFLLPHFQIKELDGGGKIEDFMEKLSYPYDPSVYKIIMDNNIGFYPIFKEDKAPSSIQVIKLKQPILDKNRHLKYLVLSVYNIHDKNVHAFYDLLVTYLDTNHLKKLS